MNDGGVYVPALLLRSYRQLGMSDSEAMLLLQLMEFRDAGGQEFPTPDELAERLGTTTRAVEGMLSRLMKDQLLTIDEQLDPRTGIQSERYNWSGWLLQASEWNAGQIKETASKAEKTTPIKRSSAAESANLFSVFEQEFGRLLSPMECETISGWIDQDRYAEEIIRFALKEAVFAGKLSFRYIDRILIEWSRNRVTNEDEARAHSHKFRGGGRS